MATVIPSTLRDPPADWAKRFERSVVTPEEIAAKVGDGARIYSVTGHACHSLMSSLIAREPGLRGVEIRRLGGFWEDYGIYNEEWVARLRLNVSFATTPSRSGIAGGVLDYTVVGFGEVERAAEQERPGTTGYEQCWFTVSPPDEDGWCCIGTELWDVRNAIRNSHVKVAGINKFLPRTFGATKIHASTIDYFYEQHEPAPVRMRRDPTPAAVAVAEHISSLVRSGDTIQIGAGSTTFPLASLGAFDGKEDLGVFAELASPGMLDLVRQGVITSKYVTLHPNKFVTTGLTPLGPEDWEYVNENPFFEFHDYDYMLSPGVIARNDNMISINNILAVDLLGQMAVSSIGRDIRAGTGGQLGYHTGAFLSKGGRAISVLPSTTTTGEVSRIVAQHPPGQIITIPWDLADTVVTEYGVADLLGKSIRQRADALIAVAHPDARPELRRAAQRIP